MTRTKHRCAGCGRSQTYRRKDLRGWRKRLYCDYHYKDVALIRCFKCPSSHDGWKRSEIRKRKGVDYCLEHLPSVADKWPNCPRCGDDDFPTFRWKGSVEATMADCDKCNYKSKALKHFDARTITTVASPLGWSPKGGN